MGVDSDREPDNRWLLMCLAVLQPSIDMNSSYSLEKPQHTQGDIYAPSQTHRSQN